MKRVVLGKVENGGALGKARAALAKSERRGKRRMFTGTKYKSNADIGN